MGASLKKKFNPTARICYTDQQKNKWMNAGALFLGQVVISYRVFLLRVIKSHV